MPELLTIKTSNSQYEFDPGNSRYRKINPEIGEWKTYYGFLKDPAVGLSLLIIRDLDRLTTTSQVTSIQEPPDEE